MSSSFVTMGGALVLAKIAFEVVLDIDSPPRATAELS